MSKKYIVDKTNIGLTFTFINPRLSTDRYRLTIIDYKISGINSNLVKDKEPNKQYYNAYFNYEKKCIEIGNFEFKNKKYKGIVLPNEIIEELNGIYTKLLEERKTLVEKITIDIINGIIPIHFKFSSDLHASYTSSIKIDQK